MQELCLPLVDSLVSSYKGASLANTRIIGVQHILETTHTMFRSLYQLGLKPENISIIGKCYSTCKEVYDEMVADGIDVSPGSFAYSSHIPFDEQFNAEINNFLSSRTHDLNAYEQVIVLDDGGKCISALSRKPISARFVIAIEQTSSGYNAICSQSLQFSVINVARSPLKLRLESPMIAQAVAERLYLSLNNKNLSPDRALILGGGAIGQAMKKRLSSDMQVVVYDLNNALSHYKSSLSYLIGSFPLIVGCTGKTSISQPMHMLISPNTTLASASSSDREFDAVYLRKQLPPNRRCHEDITVNDLLLVNSGFPVNFDGGRENIDPELIQLTIALITAGILQARESSPSPFPTIIPINSSYESKIETEFCSMNGCNIN
jgi:S-adenosylhomocysteine hydrolase